MRRMVQKIVALHLDVPHFGCLDVLCAVVRVHLQNGAVVFVGCFQRLSNLEFEGEIVYRFEHKIQRIHLIPGNGILSQIGHEHQHHARGGFPHFAGGVHPVQPRHLHIHKHNLGVLVPLFQKLCSTRIPINIKGAAMLCIVLVQTLFQLLLCCFVILYDCNVQCSIPPSPCL